MNSLEKRKAGLTKPVKVTRQMMDEHLKKVLSVPVEEYRRPFNYAGVPSSPLPRRKRY